MEDNIIFKNKFAYQFRVDMIKEELDDDDNLIAKRVFNDVPNPIDINTPFGQLHKEHIDRIELMLKEHFNKYIVCIENGKNTNKIHYQAILWSDKRIDNAEKNIKQKYFSLQKNRFKDNSISFTTAKKIKSLASYVSKSSYYIFNNLTTEQLSQIPKWLSKQNMKEEWKDKVRKHIEECVKDRLTAQQTLCSIVEFYWDNNKQHPHRKTAQYLLGKYHPNYHSIDVCDSYNLFSNYN